MGDRANIQHLTEEGTLTLYTHWCGNDSPTACKAGILAAHLDEYGQDRWQDPSFGLRLFLQGLPKGWLSRVSVGPDALDNERPILTVDWKKQVVRSDHALYGENRWTFAEFIALPDLTWDGDV